jgi:pimeloyl-ACP methyl ester carboxylesterase
MRRYVLLVVFAAALAVPAGANAAFTMTDRTVPMDDGVGIATTTYVPTGTGPFPAIVMFHGLGGTRQSIAAIAARFADRGYVVLTSDFRGHGESGGLFTGLGPRELTDIAALRERWLPQFASIDNAKVGAWGISLGGGAALRTVAEGEPYAAVQVVETWVDLYEALIPQGFPKAGAIFGFLSAVPRERQAPELLALPDAIARLDLPTLRTFAVARSTGQLLGRGYPPTMFFQGRRDFAFGLEQGLQAFDRLGGPKALYVGNFGHAPSRFPGPDFELVMTRSVAWYDRYLKGVRTGRVQPAVEIAPDPFRGRTVTYRRALPPTRDVTFTLRGNTTIAADGKVVRRTAPRPLTETFGAPLVRFTATSTTGWSHLVAVLVARRGSTSVVVSEGAAQTRLGSAPRAITIRMISQATRIPAGSRFELTLAATSTAQDPGNLLYLVPVAQSATIRIGNVRLAIPTLRRPVSR